MNKNNYIALAAAVIFAVIIAVVIAAYFVSQNSASTPRNESIDGTDHSKMEMKK